MDNLMDNFYDFMIFCELKNKLFCVLGKMCSLDVCTYSAYKMCKGVKRAAIISPLHGNAVSKPVLNPNEQHHDYYKK